MLPPMTRRQVTWRQLRVWKFPDNSLNEVQTCMTPATITHWTEQPPHWWAPCSFAPAPLTPSASPAPYYISSASFYPQTSARFPVVRYRKWIPKCVHTSCLRHTHIQIIHAMHAHIPIHLNPQWSLRRGYGCNKDVAYCGSEISNSFLSLFKPTTDTHTQKHTAYAHRHNARILYAHTFLYTWLWNNCLSRS